MRYLKYFALLAVLMLPVAYSQAQVRVGVGIGVGPGYVAGPPVCAYGYYDYAPYACAPYGFYGPDYFVGGVFIGAGPWYHWGHPAAFVGVAVDLQAAGFTGARATSRAVFTALPQFVAEQAFTAAPDSAAEPVSTAAVASTVADTGKRLDARD